MPLHVLIAGAGTAGCVLARGLASQGMQVSVLETSAPENLGHNWSDAVERRPLEEAGFALPRREGEHWVGNGVKGQDALGLFEPHVINRLHLYSPGGASLGTVNFPMIVTDRRRLARTLALAAEEAGACFYWQTKVHSLLYEGNNDAGAHALQVYGVRAQSGGNEEIEFSADLVVDATGSPGTLRRSLPPYTGMSDSYAPRDWALVYREVRQRDWQAAFSDSIPDHYQYGLFGGYRWSHQHHSTAIDIGAGVGLDRSRSHPRDLVGKLASLHPSVETEIIRGGEGRCLLGPPLDQMVAPGFLVLGDAAGMSLPTSGCGVGTALQAAQAAQRAILRAANRADTSMQALWEFNRLFFRQGRGAHLSALAGLRRFLQGLNHEELEFLYRRRVIGLAQLESALAGRFITLKLSDEVPALWKGKRRPGLLCRVSRAQGLAHSILTHYQNYPLAWDQEKFRTWKTRARQLHTRLLRLGPQG